MGKLKLMTIVGTRPEIIKMSAIIKKADKYFDQILVHTGQNYDYTLNEVLPTRDVEVLVNTNDLYSATLPLCHSATLSEAQLTQTFYERMFLAEGKPITYIQWKNN